MKLYYKILLGMSVAVGLAILMRSLGYSLFIKIHHDHYGNQQTLITIANWMFCFQSLQVWAISYMLQRTTPSYKESSCYRGFI